MSSEVIEAGYGFVALDNLLDIYERQSPRAIIIPVTVTELIADSQTLPNRTNSRLKFIRQI
jgi:hypothetical protein